MIWGTMPRVDYLYIKARSARGWKQVAGYCSGCGDA